MVYYKPPIASHPVSRCAMDDELPGVCYPSSDDEDYDGPT